MSDSLQRALVSVRAIAKQGKPVTVFARSHQASFGKGWSFDNQEPAFTGAEQLLGLLTADVLELFVRLCASRRLPVDDIEATAKAELADPLVHLGVIGANGEPRYSAFFLKAFIGSPAGAEHINALWNEAVRRAPLANTLRRAATVEISMQLV